MNYLPSIIDQRFTFTFSIYYESFYSSWTSVIRLTDDLSNSYSTYRNSVFSARMYSSTYMAFSFSDSTSANH